MLIFGFFVIAVSILLTVLKDFWLAFTKRTEGVSRCRKFYLHHGPSARWLPNSLWFRHKEDVALSLSQPLVEKRLKMRLVFIN